MLLFISLTRITLQTVIWFPTKYWSKYCMALCYICTYYRVLFAFLLFFSYLTIFRIYFACGVVVIALDCCAQGPRFESQPSGAFLWCHGCYTGELSVLCLALSVLPLLQTLSRVAETLELTIQPGFNVGTRAYITHTMESTEWDVSPVCNS